MVGGERGEVGQDPDLGGVVLWWERRGRAGPRSGRSCVMVGNSAVLWWWETVLLLRKLHNKTRDPCRKSGLIE